ncbi:hypothetical protein MTR67_023189 [Solanum verrucosum]|uniref:Uncharacterized protein n=1 Tax=Solanum verrucosum TaxID=315347 RepID=A0AAF0QT07_SOLVR|nr:hypothetical protein MTR67_023189 [Solanum verrucosum]
MKHVMVSGTKDVNAVELAELIQMGHTLRPYTMKKCFSRQIKQGCSSEQSMAGQKSRLELG